MKPPESLSVKGERGRTVTRVAKGMLGFAIGLATVGAILSTLYPVASGVMGVPAHQRTIAVPLPILLEMVPMALALWLLARGQLGPATALSVLASLVVAYMTFLEAFILGDNEWTPDMVWLDVITAALVATFVLCVLSVIACIVALVRRGSRRSA